MIATVTVMGRKRKNVDATPTTEAGGKRDTGVLRVKIEIVRQLAIISAATGRDIKDIVSPILEPAVAKLYAEVVRTLGQEVEK